MSDDELYVGYSGTMPTGTARLLRRVILPLVLAAPMIAVAVLLVHERYPSAWNDARDLREFEGILVAEPVLHLMVTRPGRDAGFSRYLVVGRGKYGPKPDIVALAGNWAKVKGSLVYREGTTVLLAKSAERIPPAKFVEVSEMGEGEWLGSFTLRGEIIDSKCHFGVMRPGNTKVHRGCAVRCIAGGIPPMLRVRDPQGNPMSFLLVSAGGEAVNQEVLDYVAEPIEITGRVMRRDDLFVLYADPRTYRRL